MSKKNDTMIKYGLMIVGILVSLSGWAFAVGIKSNQVAQNTSAIKQITTKQAADHDMLVEMRSDLKWLVKDRKGNQ